MPLELCVLPSFADRNPTLAVSSTMSCLLASDSWKWSNFPVERRRWQLWRCSWRSIASTLLRSLSWTK